LDIRIVYRDWLDERRKARMEPMSSDAHIHIMALIERFEAAQENEQLVIGKSGIFLKPVGNHDSNPFERQDNSVAENCKHEHHETVWHCFDCGEYV